MNPFSSSLIRPDHNTYRFHRDLAADRDYREAFFNELLLTLQKSRLASIVGPHGTGKTTLLRGAERRLRAAFDGVCFVSLSTERHHSWRDVIVALSSDVESSGCVRRCLIVDGFEQLSPWSRFVLVRYVRKQAQLAMLVSSHRSIWRVPVVHVTQWDVEMTKLLAAEKLADVDEPIRNKMWSRFEERLDDSSRDSRVRNVRDLWFAMYDEFESIRKQHSS